MRPLGVTDPLATDPKWLVAEDLTGGTAQVSLADAATGTVHWSIRYPGPSADPHGPPPSGPPPAGPPGGGSAGPPPGGHREPPPGPDPSRQRSEARIGGGLVALRDARNIRVVRLSDGGTVWQLTWPRPVAGIELAGDLLLIAADRLMPRTRRGAKVPQRRRGSPARWT